MSYTFRRLLDKISQRKLFFMAPQIEEFKLALKWPSNAKIVILPSNNPVIDNIISRQFSQYGVVNAKEVHEQDTQQIAQRLYDVSSKNNGALLYGFPNTIQQAHELDLLLDGVNLVVQLKLSDTIKQEISESYKKCVGCGQVFNSQLPFITPTQNGFDLNCDTPSKCLLQDTRLESSNDGQNLNQSVIDYYTDKGVLFNLEIGQEHLLLQQNEFQEKFNDALIQAIKL